MRLSHFFEIDTGCETEGRATMLARCTCEDDHGDNERRAATDSISQHDAFLRGFGVPAQGEIHREAEAETGESSLTAQRMANCTIVLASLK